MKRITLLFYIAFFSIIVNGQGAIEKQSTLSDKIFFGGGIGLQFGTYTGIEISPMVGYKPVEQLYLALKGTYQYYKDNRMDYSTDIYGGSVLAMYVLFDRIILHAEYEGLSIDKSFYYPYVDDDRVWVGSPLVGIGIRQALGQRSAIMLSLLWNLNDNYYSPYSNPIIRVNFMF